MLVFESLVLDDLLKPKSEQEIFENISKLLNISTKDLLNLFNINNKDLYLIYSKDNSYDEIFLLKTQKEALMNFVSLIMEPIEENWNREVLIASVDLSKTKGRIFDEGRVKFSEGIIKIFLECDIDYGKIKTLIKK